jgi:aromatic-L-amino-acid decarboxylase
MELFETTVLTPGLNPAHSGHFGYIPGSGLYHSALGDFLAAVSNRYAGIYAASPGAVRMEQMLIQWLIHMFGYPDTAAGDLTSGGSIANLSAIVAARDHKGLSAKDYHRAVVYFTEHTHHCVEKAVRIAGLSDCIKRFVPVDENFRMQPHALGQMITRDREDGLIPWLLVGSAGTTDTGSVDPLDDLADIARDHKIWFHVDGAYGASFVLCDQGRQMLKGMERSDSLVVDPHKGFFVPFGTGVVLVRDGMNLHRSFHYQANYMQDEKTLAKLDRMSPAELSPELSRHFRGMRLWLPLKLLGVKPFRAALAEKMLLAAYFYERIQEIEGIETGPFPDLSIVIFRYLPKRGNADAFNEKLIEKIMNHGRVFLSSTRIHGNVMLRLAVLSFRTHLEKVDEAITIVEEMIDQVKKELSVL